MGSLLAAWTLACGSAPPPKPRPASPVVDDTPDPQSSEWLYATKGLSSSSLKGECLRVQSTLQEEKNCKGEACGYASRLSQDWLRRCRKATPEAVEAVSQLSFVFAERERGQRVPCLREIESVVRSGCGADATCPDMVQGWTTRCSDAVGSPLLLRILEARLQSDRGGGLKLDRRGCQELRSDLLGASNCAQKFQCEDALKAVETYRKRCLAPGTLPTVTEALADVSVQLGAGLTPKALAISAENTAIQLDRFALPLADESGIVALTCGERAADLAAYLELRQSCGEGELVVLRRHSERRKNAATLKIGRFPLTSDDLFQQNYPSLVVKGELDKRRSTLLVRLTSDLESLSARISKPEKYDPQVGAALLQALDKASFALRELHQTTGLDERDAALVPFFKGLAKAKLQAAKNLFKQLEYAAFARRSLKRPLADLDAEGNLTPGAASAAAGLDLAAILPKSTAAYLAELGTLAERVQKKALTEKQQRDLAEQAAQARTACSTTLSKVRENETDLAECGFGAVCDQELMTELQTELKAGHAQGPLAFARFELARDSLDAAAASEDSTCGSPWW